jgi:flagellar protein FliO/FliZ
MRSWMQKLAASGCLLLPFAVHCAEATPAPAKRFAAPGAATSLPHTGMGGIGQVTVALLIVLALVFALAFLLKKMRAATGATANGIEVLAQASLGAKERAVVIRVDGTRFLLGVAQGQVSLLQVLSTTAPSAPAAPPASPSTEKPNFAQLLRRSLGR